MEKPTAGRRAVDDDGPRDPGAVPAGPAGVAGPVVAMV
jgi:hypothetical protein